MYNIFRNPSHVCECSCCHASLNIVLKCSSQFNTCFWPAEGSTVNATNAYSNNYYQPIVSILLRPGNR